MIPKRLHWPNKQTVPTALDSSSTYINGNADAVSLVLMRFYRPRHQNSDSPRSQYDHLRLKLAAFLCSFGLWLAVLYLLLLM